MDLQTAIEALQPFCGGKNDVAWKQRPFGTIVEGKQYCAATDGCRAALILCPEAEGLKVPDAAPLDHVVPRFVDYLGSIYVDGLKPARELPRAWRSSLEWRDGEVWLACDRVRGTGPRQKITQIIERAKVSWGPKLDVRTATGINVGYLLDALDLFDFPNVDVWQQDGYEPFVFAVGQSIEKCDPKNVDCPYLQAQAFVVNMPVRV